MELREFIDLLSKERLLRRVDREVDWRFELGRFRGIIRSRCCSRESRIIPGTGYSQME